MKVSVDDYIVEWDSAKNAANIRKHGVDFETAAYIFTDVNRLEFYDELHSQEEERYYTIGKVGDVLFVVYTDREPVLRLISARYATKEEEAVYYGNC